jgi:pyridoxal phosphate enzyme (YggS family)
MKVRSFAVAAHLDRVRERIAHAAARAGGRAEEINLVAVSKTFPAEAIREAYAAGLRHFGENRVQEWESKQPLLADLDATWHLIGHLQSNKARRAARLFHRVDSLDSVALAGKLDASLGEGVGSPSALGDPGERRERRLGVLVEVRLAPEDSKTGVSEPELEKVAQAVLRLPHLDLRGLMTIPPLFEDPEQARPFFRRLRELRDTLCRRLGRALPELSMGMSHDFELAIEEGATQLRLGTALFGPRTAE